MSGPDERELEELKSVSCAVLLERQAPPYTLDKTESSRNCLKYRRGRGEIILVTHGGRGWWDPGSTTARGDIFNLVQHLQPGLNFGQARKVLRDFVGLTQATRSTRSRATGPSRRCRSAHDGRGDRSCGAVRPHGAT